jgi:hypothetical protein
MKLHLRKNILTAIVFGSIFSVSAQIDTTIWNSTKKIEDNRFVAEIPQDWKVVTIANASEYSHKYEFTGIGIKANGVAKSGDCISHHQKSGTNGCKSNS